MSIEPIQDNVEVTFTVEEPIKTDTVKITAQVIAVMGSGETDVRAKIQDTLRKILEGEWAFTALDRASTSAGQEQVTASATIRVEEAKAVGFAKKCSNLSVEGLQIRPGAISYDPPRNMVEEAKTKLRKKIYELAMAEAKTLNDVAHNGAPSEWRIGVIQFLEGAPAYANSTRNMAPSGGAAYAMTVMAEAGGGGDIGLSQRVSLSASVSLHRVAHPALPTNTKQK